MTKDNQKPELKNAIELAAAGTSFILSINPATAVIGAITGDRTTFVSNVAVNLSVIMSATPGYSETVKRECLKMYVNGMGFRAIERIKGVHHTTLITWVRLVGKLLLDAYDPEARPEVGELDELQTYVKKKHKIWLWTAV